MRRRIAFNLTEMTIFPVAMRLGVTPVLIPNTTVKTQAAEGTMLETIWENRWLPDYGGLAQLGEHLPCKQGVMSSNLTISTKALSRAGHQSIGSAVLARKLTRI